jgi:curved DNA-binding protein CbpA
VSAVVEEPEDDDYYELLQISPSAEPETIHRVYRLLAQRFHPDNPDTGNEARFRTLHAAYLVLSDPAERAKYDVRYHQHRHTRWHTQSADGHGANEFEIEQFVRLTVLEVLYRNRREQPHSPGVFVLDLEQLTGHPRELLDFTTWYLLQRKLVVRGDNSRLMISADGVDYLEAHYEAHLQRRRLMAVNSPAVPVEPAAS